jgi:hypothetical protein
MDNIHTQPNQWIQGEAENQSAIMLAQHATYFLRYKIRINSDGSQEMINEETLDFVEPYNPDYPLAYLKGGQKALNANAKAQQIAYSVASKIMSNLKPEQLKEIKNAEGNNKYDLIAKHLSQDSASNVKFCVDYFNDFSRRSQSLIAGSRTTGINPQQMREFRTPIDPIAQINPDDQKPSMFKR